MKNTISVIIPTFNRENTITYCLESVLNQTLPPNEIIIVDDLSTDNTIEIIKKMDSKLIKIIRLNKKGGAQVARNVGVRAAKNNWIAFLDSDDTWIPTKLEIQYEILKNKNFNYNLMLYSNCYRYYPEIEKYELWELPKFEGNQSFKFLLQTPGPMFQGLIVSKDKLEEIGFLDESIVSYQEWDTSIMLSRICDVIHIESPLFNYHFHSGETISKDKYKDVCGYKQIVDKYKAEFELFPDLEIYQHHMIFLFERCISYEMWEEAKYYLSEINPKNKNFHLFNNMLNNKKMMPKTSRRQRIYRTLTRRIRHLLGL